MRGVFGHTRVVTLMTDVPASGLFLSFICVRCVPECGCV